MSRPIHIPHLDQFPDLQQQYTREWRQSGSCSSGCGNSKLAAKFMRAVALRKSLLVAHAKTRR